MTLIGDVLKMVVGIPSTTERALLDTMCLAGTAEGRATQLELGHAREIALDMPGFRRYSRDELQRELEEALEEVKSTEPEQMMERIADSISDPERREQAYALASVVVYVDMDKSAVESAFLGRLREALGITESRAAAIMKEIESEVASIRRGEQHAPGT